MPNAANDLSSEFFNRAVSLEQEKRDRAEDLRELFKEAKDRELLPEEIAGIKLAVRRYFETDKAKKKRESAEEFAAALGPLLGTPLGDTAQPR